jgi:hypothetical protein
MKPVYLILPLYTLVFGVCGPLPFFLELVPLLYPVSNSFTIFEWQIADYTQNQHILKNCSSTVIVPTEISKSQ